MPYFIKQNSSNWVTSWLNISNHFVFQPLYETLHFSNQSYKKKKKSHPYFLCSTLGLIVLRLMLGLRYAGLEKKCKRDVNTKLFGELQWHKISINIGLSLSSVIHTDRTIYFPVSFTFCLCKPSINACRYHRGSML